jgi:hypothetical protein
MGAAMADEDDEIPVSEREKLDLELEQYVYQPIAKLIEELEPEPPKFPTILIRSEES